MAPGVFTQHKRHGKWHDYSAQMKRHLACPLNTSGMTRHHQVVYSSSQMARQVEDFTKHKWRHKRLH
eukprot:scaffold82960_cov21-Tisochrysis_lutea.AAC.1